MTSIRNLFTSIVAAVAIVAAILVVGFNPGIASAAPAQQAIAANVALTIPAAPNVGGNYDETPGQSWVWLYRVADHKSYTGTVATAVAAHNIGNPGNHELKPNGGRMFRGSADAGDFLIVAHLGANTYVMNQIVSIADGNQLPGQTHTMTWTGSGTNTTTGKTGGTAAKPAAKAAAPLGTPLCVVTAAKPTVTTGFAAIVSGGATWTGKVVFVPVNVKLLRVEEGQALAKKMAGDAKSDKVLNFGSVPDGTNMRLGSGDYQAYRLTAGDPVYLGYLQASPGGTYNTVTTVNGACTVYDLKALRTPGTGAALNLLALFMLFGGLAVAAVLNRDKLAFIRLPSIG